MSDSPGPEIPYPRRWTEQDYLEARAKLAMVDRIEPELAKLIKAVKKADKRGEL